MTDFAKLAWLVGATLAGTSFSLWTGGFTKGWLSALTLVSICALLSVYGDHPLGWHSPPLVWISLLGGLAFGLCFPCCTSVQRVGPMAVLGTSLIFCHCLLDGHVVREANTLPLTAIFGIHKFLDGTDGRLLSLGNKNATLFARAALALATPLGFLTISPTLVSSTVHLSLFATVIGFNIGTAVHIVRHELHERKASPLPIHPTGEF